MDRIIHALLIALAMGLVGCDAGLSGALLATEQDGAKTVLITSSPGGNIDAFDRAFRNWSAITGVKVEIRRWCASACTQVLSHFQPEQVCLSPGARVGCHSATGRAAQVFRSNFGSGVSAAAPDTDAISTLILFAGYPGWVQQRLAVAGVMGRAAGNPATSIGADEFWYHGYLVCAEPTVTTAGRSGAERRGG